MIEKHLRMLRVRDDVSLEEEAVLLALISETREVPAKTNFIRAGQRLSSSTLLLEGMMCRHKDLREGERQITDLHLAGDFVDLHGFTLKRLDHHLMTLTPCKVAIVPHERLKALSEHHPHLSRLYWFCTNMDAASHREWELSLGRRMAIARVSHLLCELRIRFELVGMTNGPAFALPLTQVELAECVGLTPVHVNRIVRQLRERGLTDVRRGHVKILDLPGLETLAEFDPNYLYLEKLPR